MDSLIPSGSISIGSVVGYLHLDIGSWNAGIASAQSMLHTFTGQAQRNMRAISAGMTAVGRQATLLGGVLSGSIGLGVKLFSDFENAMRESTAVSDTSTEQFSKMALMAERASIAINRGSKETAEAFYYLGSAGLSAQEQMDAFYAATFFARAGVMDVGEAVEILVDIMKGFDFSFKNTVEVADILTAAFTSSNTHLSELGESMSLVASIAHDTHTPIDQVAAALGLMANAGIKGSRAGTALRRAFTNLMNPSKEMQDELNKWGVEVYDASGQMKPFIQLVNDLTSALQGATEEQKNQAYSTLYGVRAITGMLMVHRDLGSLFREFTSTLQESEGAMKRVVDKMMVSFHNKLGSTQKRVSMLGRHIGATLVPYLTNLLNKLDPIIEQTIVWVDSNKELVATLVKVGAVVGVVTTALGATLMTLGGIMWSLSYVIPLFSQLGAAALGALSSLLGPAGVVIFALTAIGGAAYALYAAFNNNFNGIADDFKELGEYIAKGWNWLADKTKPFLDWLAHAFDNTFDTIIETSKELSRTLFGTFYSIKEAMTAAWEGDIWSGATYWKNIKNSWNRGFDEATFLWDRKAPEVAEGVVDTFKTAGSAMSNFGIALGEEAGTFFTDYWEVIKKQWNEDTDALIAMLGDKFPQVKKALDSWKGLLAAPGFGAIGLPSGKGLPSTDPGIASDRQTNWLKMGFNDYYDDIIKKWPKLTDFMRESTVTLAQDIESSMSNAFAAAIEGAESFGDAVSAMLTEIRNSMIKMIADIAAQAVMRGVLSSVLGGIMPFGSTAFTGSTQAGIPGGGYATAHNGLPFGKVPRFHSGLAPDEFPAILEKGEAVIPKNYSKDYFAPKATEVKIELINQSSSNIQATQKNQEMRGDVMVTQILLRDSQNYGPLKSAGVIG